MSTIRTEPNTEPFLDELRVRRVVVAHAPPPAVPGGVAVIGSEPLVLGRGRTESAFGLTLDDPKVSRRHATIVVDPDGNLLHFATVPGEA